MLFRSKNKRIVVALTYIYGIGPTRAREICASAKVSEDTRTDNLTVEEIKLKKHVNINSKSMY